MVGARVQGYGGQQWKLHAGQMVIPTFHWIGWVSNDVDDPPAQIAFGTSLAPSIAPGGPASPGNLQVPAQPEFQFDAPGSMELVQANLTYARLPAGAPLPVVLGISSALPAGPVGYASFPALLLAPNVAGQDVDVAALPAAVRTVAKGLHGSLRLGGLDAIGSSQSFSVHLAAVWRYTP